MNGSESRIEPPAAVMDAVRSWLAPVRAALESEFLAAFVTGGALTAGFDPKRSRVNVLVVAKALPVERLDALAQAIPRAGRPGIEPLFVTLDQVSASLDAFPIEWLDVFGRNLRVEGVDVFAELSVPRTNLRLQLEHELRGKHLRLRQAYIAAGGRPERMRQALVAMASGFHTLFRTLLRLEGEAVPASHERVIERIADLHGLEARPLLGVHLLRRGTGPRHADELRELYRGFLAQIERLVGAIDRLRVT